MQVYYRWGAVCALLSMMALPAIADTAAQPEVTVVVTAERISQPVSASIASTTVITAKQILEAGAKTAADAVRMSPGITVNQAGQLGSLTSTYIRGAKPNQVLILIDGARFSSEAFVSGADLSKIPAEDIQRIEVIRGPVSSLYGSEAIGGVINIITKKPTETAGNTTLGFGGDGRVERTLSVKGAEGPALWQLTTIDPVYTGTRPNSDFSASNWLAKLILPSVSGWELSMRGETYYDSLGLPGADVNHTGYFDPDNRQSDERHGFDFAASRDMGSGQLEARWYSLEQTLHNVKPGAFGWDSFIGGLTRAAEVNYKFASGSHSWVVGGEYRQEDYTDIEGGFFPSTQENTVLSRALYAQDRWYVLPGTDIVMGARMDNHSAFGSKITPRVGINRLMGAKSHMRVSYGEGFRAPNFVELYYHSTFGPGYAGNPNLMPEKSKQYEIGWNVQAGDLDNFDLAVYHNDIRDMIQATSATPYENIGSARQQGAEVSWDHRFTQSTRLNVNYSYINAQNGTTGERLTLIPHNQGNVSLSTLVKDWQIALTGRWTDARPDKAFDPVTYASVDTVLPSRTVFDLTITGRRPNALNPYIIVRNLADLKYDEITGYPSEGRTLEAGVRSAW